MIRNFTKEEVLEAFIETVREKGPVLLAEKYVRTSLGLSLHGIIKEAIEKVIKKASPNLSLAVSVEPIEAYSYRTAYSYEPYFNMDPSDAHFYVSREACPYSLNEHGPLTKTIIGIDYYYPAPWAMTPPKDEKMAIRRSMDEILFAWTIVYKTLTQAPIVRFDDEEEAAEATFAFANALLFKRVVANTPYYKADFLRRLLFIEDAIKGDQPANNQYLGTILYPPSRKIGQLEIPVANILRNRLTQYVEGWLPNYGYNEFSKVVSAFTFVDFNGEGIPEGDIGNYLSNEVGRATDEFRRYNMSQIQSLASSNNYKTTRPPRISARFKDVSFYDVCPFTYGSKSFVSIHFEKDIVSHLAKTFQHLDFEDAIDIARNVDLPKPNEVNDGYDVDITIIEDMFHLRSMEGTPDAIRMAQGSYQNEGLAKAEVQEEVQENIRSMEFAEESVVRGALREYTPHWSDVPF